MRALQRREHLLLSAASALVLGEWALRPALSATQWQAVETALELALLALVAWHRSRRELAPLYAALLALAGAHVLPDTGVISALLLCVQSAGVALAWVSALLFPWPDLTQLHGEFAAIGCVPARLGGVDCRVYYPSTLPLSPSSSSVARGSGVRYLLPGEHLLRGLSAYAKLPAWLFLNLRNAELAAVEAAPLAAGVARWPLALVSHGLGGSLELYAHLSQQLASSGLVVVALTHGDGSACAWRGADGHARHYQPVSQEVRDDVDGAGFRFRNAQLRQRVGELRAVLHAIDARTAAPSPAKTTTPVVTLDDVLARTDTRAVGLVGHSFGAATALSAALEDERVVRAVLLDAWMEPVDAAARLGLGARVPALHLQSEHFFRWRENAEHARRHARGSTHAHSRFAVLRGSRHENFSDLPVFAPRLTRWMQAAGVIDPYYALRAIGQLSAAFLRGGFLEQASQFPEVEIVDP